MTGLRHVVPVLLALVAGCARPGAKAGAPEPAGLAPGDSPEVSQPTAPSRPRLVVLLVVDQMRGDYLERFGHLWKAGFQRLRREGALFTRAHHRHAVTFTAAGHATLATGVHPARHGMISNRYWDRQARTKVEVADDPGTKVVGPGTEPAQSPHRLRRDGVGDWLRAASPESLVLSVGLKSRAVVCMGGRKPSAAFWHDEKTGKMVTSAHYMDALPGWIQDFNHRLDAPALVARGWDRVASPEVYAFMGPDAVPYEADGVHTSFPHDEADLLALDGSPHRALRWSAAGDEVTFDLADRVLAHAGLGTDDAPDLLMITVSSTDYVGHRYGPDSHELLDIYLRLDEQLGAFLQSLDRRVGEGAWALVLTSDHGVMPVPERVEGGKRIALKELEPLLARVMKQAARKTGLRPVPRPHVSDGIYLEFDPSTAEPERAAFRAALADALETRPMVRRAYDPGDFESPPVDAPFLEAFRHSRDPERSPDVFVLLEPHHLFTPFQGTSHGTPYPHDTHVPLVVMGAGVEPGTHDEPVSAVDVAPTLARLLGIAAPDDLDGRPLRVDGDAP